jgi:hypothetical protein
MCHPEVTDLIPQLGTETFYDEDSVSRWMVSSLSQWISYEDAESFGGKVQLIMRRCLKGFAVSSLDLDTQDYQALTALVGEDAMVHGIVENQLSRGERQRLVSDLAAYTGQNCYIAEGCTDGTGDDDRATCGSGYMAVESGHAPTLFGARTLSKCDEGKWHYICCPKASLPNNCEWRGAPEQSEFGCSAGCGNSQYELATDTFLDPEGQGDCFSGRRSVSASDATGTLPLRLTGVTDLAPPMPVAVLRQDRNPR